METKLKFYAMADETMFGKKEYGSGFLNTKTAIAFESKKDREEFLSNTFDLTAKPINRRYALKFAFAIYGDREANGCGIELYSSERHLKSETYESLIPTYIKLKD